MRFSLAIEVKACRYARYFLKIDYFPTGWPYALVNRISSLIGGRGKVKQPRMVLDYWNCGIGNVWQ